MKLLYVACGHPLCESDDCLMWDRAGIKWTSTGYYAFTERPLDLPRLYKNRIEDDDIRLQTSSRHPAEVKPLLVKNLTYTGMLHNNVWKFTQEFIDKYDVIVFTHLVENITNNWDVLKNKTVILKTFGMHEHYEEQNIRKLRNKGLIVVRNSPEEKYRCRYFGGEDHIIYGSVVTDETEISGWTGHKPQIVTFSNTFNFGNNSPVAIKRRERYIRLIRICMQLGISDDIFHLFGAGNDGEPLCLRKYISHQEKIKEMQDSRINLVVGTPNANNTFSFADSWIMGMPTVVFGRKLWQSPLSYEPDKLITNGVDGFVSDNLDELAQMIKKLLDDYDYAKAMGEAGRKKAISVYGREIGVERWKQLFRDKGFTI